MSLNQYKDVKLYLVLLAALGTSLFIIFLVGNLIVANKNSDYIETSFKRDLPLINNYLILKQEVSQLKSNFEDAIVFENDLLVHEAEGQVEVIRGVLSKIDSISAEQLKNELTDLRRALDSYNEKAIQLTLLLIDNTNDLSELTSQAEKVNQSYHYLNNLIQTQLENHQHKHANYLNLTNENLLEASRRTAIVGCFLVIILLLFTMFIKNKILNSLYRADQVKENFLSTINHELRTPLNGIKGAFELLIDHPLSPKQRHFIEVARASSKRMEKTVDDIIVFSELLSSDLMSTPSIGKISLLVNIANTYAAEQLKDRSHVFSCSSQYAEDLIKYDEEKTQRIMVQLIDNAIKYGAEGLITVHIECKTSASQNLKGNLVITVTDQGEGFETKQLEQLLSPFEQGQSGWNRSHQGVGLGLSMSRLMTLAMKGRLEFLNNKKGKGCIARLCVPVEMLEEKEKAHFRAKNTHTKPILPTKVKVLIVEDDKSNQIILTSYIKKLGLPFVIANNGQEAVECFKEDDFGIVLMDCQMPVMDGFKATQIIREISKEQGSINIPIIAITANTRDADKAKCFEVGMNDFLPKPVKQTAVHGVISQYLS